MIKVYPDNDKNMFSAKYLDRERLLILKFLTKVSALQRYVFQSHTYHSYNVSVFN